MFESMAPAGLPLLPPVGPRPVQCRHTDAPPPGMPLDLRTGTTAWEAADPEPIDAAPLHCDIKTDVIVLGGGITGALGAYHLARAGVGVVVLDRRPFARGSTSASTALIQYETDLTLLELASLHGLDHARRVYKTCYRALDDLSAVAAVLPHASGIESKNSLFLAARREHVSMFQQEAELRRALGISVQTVSQGELMHRWSIDRPGALFSDKALQLDPVRMTGALLHAARQCGAQLFTQATAETYECTDDGVSIGFAGGFTAQGRRAIFATGYETPAFFGPSRCTLKSTYAVAATAEDGLFGWPDNCLLWEKNDPYLYARTTVGASVILGGEDDNFYDPAERAKRLPAKCATLLSKFKRLFPHLSFRIDHAWAGVFAETPDSLPFIGALPHFPHGYFALGYGGNGILFSLIAAQILTDQFMGRPNADAELFRFDR